MALEKLWWFECPRGHLGTIDADQRAGTASIECKYEGGCKFHGHAHEGDVLGPVREGSADGPLVGRSAS